MEWQDDGSLATAGLKVNPSNAKIHLCMGNYLAKKVCTGNRRNCIRELVTRRKNQYHIVGLILEAQTNATFWRNTPTTASCQSINLAITLQVSTRTIGAFL